MNKALFIDRDDTINVDYGYTNEIKDLKIYPDVAKIIKSYNKLGYLTIVVSNQAGIGRGYYPEKDVQKFNKAIAARLAKRGAKIDAFYYCPHQPQDNCDCRKPKTGLIKRAARDFNIDIKKSIVIGDRDDIDGEMARRLKMRYRILKRKETLKYNSLKAALVLAGGKGTRLGPITKKTPKPLVDVNGKPAIYYVIKELAANGIKEIYVSLGYKADKLIHYLDKLPQKDYSISYVVEKTPLGTGGAVKLGINAISKNHSGDVLILNGDDLFKLNIRKMYLEHLRSRATLTLSAKKVRNVRGSGVIAIKGKRITKFVEKPEPKYAPSNIINTGKYIVNLKIKSILPKKRVFMFEKDFLSNLNYNKIKVYCYLSNDKIYGVDTPEKLARAREKWKS